MSKDRNLKLTNSHATRNNRMEMPSQMAFSYYRIGQMASKAREKAVVLWHRWDESLSSINEIKVSAAC